MIQVSVGIIFNDGKILLCQRTATARYPLKWEFPGGKIEKGESPEDCLRRELLEELGVTIERWKLFHQQHAVYPDSGSFDVNYYLISAYNGTIVNNVFASVKWVLTKELVEYDILEGNREVVQKLLSMHDKTEANTR